MARKDDRLTDEIKFHIEQQTAKNIRAGMTPEDARRAALVKFGGVEQAREAARDEFRGAWIADFLRDLRVSFRSLRRMPSFAVATVVTFALGLGAAVAMFSVVNGVLLRPLPYPESDRIVRLYQLTDKGVRSNVSGPNFGDWQSGTHSFQHMSVYANYGRIPVTGLGDPQMVATIRASQEFFKAMGVEPAQGRLFAAPEYLEDHPHVGVIGARFAERIGAGGAPVGRRFTYDGESITIVGVMPKDFDYPAGTDVWLPLDDAATLKRSRTAHNYQSVARLADGVSLASARSEISNLSRGLKPRYGDATWMFDADAVPILDVMTGSSKASLELLLGAAILLLIVATTNVSNMLVARGASRRQEFAVQAAIGATSGRIARQLLAETFALCLAGAALGMALAETAVRLFIALGPDSAPRLNAIAIDWTSAAFAGAAVVVISSILAIVTASSARSRHLTAALTEESRGGSTGRKQMRLRESLIVIEVALTLVLLVGGGLMARSLSRVLAINPGFRTDDALVADLTMNSQGPDGIRRRVRDQAEIVSRISALPGVEAAGFINSFPIGRGFFSNGQFIEMTRADEFTTYDQMQALGAALKPRQGFAAYRVANGGYFKAMGIPLVRGRLLNDGDVEAAPQAAVISESLAKQRWPDQDPIGRYLQYGNMDGDMRGIRIVGIVGDVREVTIEQAPPAIVYVSYLQRPGQASTFSLVVRGPAPDQIADTVRRVIHDVSSTTPVEIRSTTAALDAATGARRFNFWLIGAFAVTALVLAAIGVYGLVSFMVAQRAREMGIRMALGAEPGSLVRLVVGRGVTLAIVGSALGLGIALLLTSFIEGLLFGVTATDPSVLAGIAATTMAVTAVASIVPARRILKRSPSSTLRDI
jgi:predicted permease